MSPEQVAMSDEEISAGQQGVTLVRTTYKVASVKGLSYVSAYKLAAAHDIHLDGLNEINHSPDRGQKQNNCSLCWKSKVERGKF